MKCDNILFLHPLIAIYSTGGTYLDEGWMNVYTINYHCDDAIKERVL